MLKYSSYCIITAAVIVGLADTEVVHFVMAFIVMLDSGFASPNNLTLWITISGIRQIGDDIYAAGQARFQRFVRKIVANVVTARGKLGKRSTFDIGIGIWKGWPGVGPAVFTVCQQRDRSRRRLS